MIHPSKIVAGVAGDAVTVGVASLAVEGTDVAAGYGGVQESQGRTLAGTSIGRENEPSRDALVALCIGVAVETVGKEGTVDAESVVVLLQIRTHAETKRGHSDLPHKRGI